MSGPENKQNNRDKPPDSETLKRLRTFPPSLAPNPPQFSKPPLIQRGKEEEENIPFLPEEWVKEGFLKEENPKSVRISAPPKLPPRPPGPNKRATSTAEVEKEWKMLLRSNSGMNPPLPSSGAPPRGTEGSLADPSGPSNKENSSVNLDEASLSTSDLEEEMFLAQLRQRTRKLTLATVLTGSALLVGGYGLFQRRNQNSGKESQIDPKALEGVVPLSSKDSLTDPKRKPEEEGNPKALGYDHLSFPQALESKVVPDLLQKLNQLEKDSSPIEILTARLLELHALLSRFGELSCMPSPKKKKKKTKPPCTFHSNPTWSLGTWQDYLADQSLEKLEKALLNHPKLRELRAKKESLTPKEKALMEAEEQLRPLLQALVLKIQEK